MQDHIDLQQAIELADQCTKLAKRTKIVQKYELVERLSFLRKLLLTKVEKQKPPCNPLTKTAHLCRYKSHTQIQTARTSVDLPIK